MSTNVLTMEQDSIKLPTISVPAIKVNKSLSQDTVNPIPTKTDSKQRSKVSIKVELFYLQGQRERLDKEILHYNDYRFNATASFSQPTKLLLEQNLQALLLELLEIQSQIVVLQQSLSNFSLSL